MNPWDSCFKFNFLAKEKTGDNSNGMQRIAAYSILLLLAVKCVCGTGIPKNPPHIIFILADDLGWNDISFHGSPEVPTPNIDALALNGITLHNHYTESMCTPSRGALLSGLYPIRFGLQHGVILEGERSGLPVDITIMPQHLQKLGYETHMIGKWHLGFYTKDHMPTHRGFKTFLGYLNGAMDYYDYTNGNSGYPTEPTEQFYFGVDFFNGTRPVTHFRGRYATHVFAETARDIILDHDVTKPLFLYLPHLAVHASGTTQRVQAPPEIVRKFMYIKDKNRRIYAGMTTALDDAVGTVFEALHKKSMLENSIVLFISDNGGEVAPENGGFGTNYPLRGRKGTFWEGGIRASGIVWSPLLNLQEPRISEDLMHISDWLPTLYRAAGGDPRELGNIDGYDMWDVLINKSPSPRKDVLHNIDPIFGASAYRNGNLKVINGTTYPGYAFWYGASGFEHVNPASMESWIFKNGSTVRNILTEMGWWIATNPDNWYRQSRVVCPQPPPQNAYKCNVDKKPCLFNIRTDPCEYYDLADSYPEVVKAMMNVIYNYQRVAATPQSKKPDPLANPMCHDFHFVPWMDPEYFNSCDFLS